MEIIEVLSNETYNKARKNLITVIDSIKTKPIIIFGCGYLGETIGKFLSSKKYNVVAYSDNNNLKWNKNINDLPIIPPPKAAKLYGDSALFIVCIWSPGHQYAKTKNQLADLGIKSLVHVAAIMQLFPNELLPHFHFQTPDYYFKYQNELKEVYDLLADEDSKKQYLAHIDCRINLNFDGLPIANIENQYFPSEIIRLSENETFLDAGAYDGDTLQEFCERTDYKFHKYIALEPDPINRDKLESRVRSSGIKNVLVFPYAVGDKNCVLKFNASGGTGAAISNVGSLDVECVRIDDKFYNEPNSYMKFDIEGAELMALHGAEETIGMHKPKLAVCLYHKPDDIWTIPLYLKSKFPFYKFFVRTHHFDGWEFVLYAIPPLKTLSNMPIYTLNDHSDIAYEKVSRQWLINYALMKSNHPDKKE